MILITLNSLLFKVSCHYTLRFIIAFILLTKRKGFKIEIRPEVRHRSIPLFFNSQSFRFDEFLSVWERKCESLWSAQLLHGVSLNVNTISYWNVEVCQIEDRFKMQNMRNWLLYHCTIVLVVSLAFLLEANVQVLWSVDPPRVVLAAQLLPAEHLWDVSCSSTKSCPTLKASLSSREAW